MATNSAETSIDLEAIGPDESHHALSQTGLFVI